MEYKSPDDSLNIDTFYKTLTYVYFYKTDGETVDERQIDDITLSIVIESKPMELFNSLEEMNAKITMPYSGIYYIDGITWFPTQVIVTSELEGHTWLKSLSSNMEMSDMKNLLDETAKLKGEHEKELANSVLDTALKANKDLAEELVTDNYISEELLKLVEPLIQDQKQIWIQKGKQEGQISGAVNALRSLNHSDDEIKTVIMKNYNLSEEEAKKHLRNT